VSGPQPPVAAPTPPLLNVANLLTLLRLLLVPVFFAMLVVDGGHDPAWRLAACGVFALASFTDRLDGDLARRRGLVTPLGVIADPIADKALTGAALVGLSLLGELPWWVTVVIVGREIAVTGLRFWVLRRGLIPASRGGKLKTLAQTVAIGLYLLPLELILPAPGLVEVLRWTVMAVALVLTVLTGVDYVLRAIRLRRGPGEVPTTPNQRVSEGPG
jgi:CDP-diacylglycerol--glycerol-3-phosphate 3-phosphatidyltransferase